MNRALVAGLLLVVGAGVAVFLLRSADPHRRNAEVSAEGAAEDAAALLAELREACEALTAAIGGPVEQARLESRIDELVARLGTLGGEGLSALHRAVTETGPTVYRRKALDGLARAAPDRAKDVGAELLARAGEDFLVRVHGAKVLYDLDGAEGARAVAARVNAESERTFPPLADLVDLLGERGGEGAVDALLALLRQRERGPSACYRALDALGRLRAAEAVSTLHAIIVGESVDHLLRRKAVQALVAIEAREACPFLERCAAEEREPGFKVFLVDTLDLRCR